MEKLVLLVDDDHTFNWVSTKLIQRVCPELKINICTNGRMALEFLLNNFENQYEYIIFLDINMPEMNGWEFLDAIAKSQWDINQSSVSIYIVSSSTDSSDMEKAKTYRSVKGYITKPLSLDTIKGIMV